LLQEPIHRKPSVSKFVVHRSGTPRTKKTKPAPAAAKAEEKQ